MTQLMSKRFGVPAWVQHGHNEFPFRVLVADCALWAAATASAFIDHAFDKLGVLSVLDHNRSAGSAFAPLLPDRKRETPK